MSGHTPGPWSAESGNSITADFGGIGVAILEPLESFWCGDCSHHPKGDEADANARLIAAAPELLAACKLALETFNSGAYSEKACRKLEAAIAKATGEKP